jgi:hypothetical protein
MGRCAGIPRELTTSGENHRNPKEEGRAAVNREQDVSQQRSWGITYKERLRNKAATCSARQR